MWKNKLLIGLGVAMVLVEIVGFTDFMKQYIIIAFALVVILLSVWQYSESKEK